MKIKKFSPLLHKIFFFPADQVALSPTQRVSNTAHISRNPLQFRPLNEVKLDLIFQLNASYDHDHHDHHDHHDDDDLDHHNDQQKPDQMLHQTTLIPQSNPPVSHGP